MRTGLMIFATVATLATGAIAAPAMANGQYYDHDHGRGYGDRHDGRWDRHDRWDHHRDARRDHWRHEREREWRHRHHREYSYGYGNYYGW